MYHKKIKIKNNDYTKEVNLYESRNDDSGEPVVRIEAFFEKDDSSMIHTEVLEFQYEFISGFIEDFSEKSAQIFIESFDLNNL